jgi:hypothetical protein
VGAERRPLHGLVGPQSRRFALIRIKWLLYFLVDLP